MPVSVTKTAGNRAEVTWEPSEDDPRGYLARAVEGDQLAYALEALGDEQGTHSTSTGEEAALQAAMHTTALARLLERRAAVQVVRLREEYGLSWRRIATVLHDDPERQSTVRRQYETGRRHLGV